MTVRHPVSYLVKYPISYGGLGYQKSIVVQNTLALASSNPASTVSAAVGVDAIEANFFGAWLESHWSFGGPEEAIKLSEVLFFDC